MQTAESVSTIEPTQRLVTISDSTYVKENLKQVSYNSMQLNADEITQLLWLLKYSQGFFDVTLGYWDTDPMDLELNPYY